MVGLGRDVGGGLVGLVGWGLVVARVVRVCHVGEGCTLSVIRT